MAPDALLVLQDGYVSKAADFDGTAVDFGLQLSQTNRPIWARVRYYNAKNASGANAVRFGIKSGAVSTTLHERVWSAPIDLTTTAKRGVVNLSMLDLDRYNAITVDISGAGGTPTVTFEASVGFAKL